MTAFGYGRAASCQPLSRKVMWMMSSIGVLEEPCRRGLFSFEVAVALPRQVPASLAIDWFSPSRYYISDSYCIKLVKLMSYLNFSWKLYFFISATREKLPNIAKYSTWERSSLLVKMVHFHAQKWTSNFPAFRSRLRKSQSTQWLVS